MNALTLSKKESTRIPLIAQKALRSSGVMSNVPENSIREVISSFPQYFPNYTRNFKILKMYQLKITDRKSSSSNVQTQLLLIGFILFLKPTLGWSVYLIIDNKFIVK